VKDYKYDFKDILRFIVKFIELGAYLEERGYVHRDIKPGNIIIFDDRLDFKLGDFGLGCRAYERPRGFAGTPAYCSPGLKKFLKDGNHRMRPCTNAFKDDVYSFALTS
jgi:serine/threonine protein kinase